MDGCLVFDPFVCSSYVICIIRNIQMIKMDENMNVL